MKLSISKYLGLGLVAAGSLAFASCDDYLDVQPESSFSNEEIFSSEKETRAMMNTIYSKLTSNNLYGQHLPYTFNTNTDVEMRSSDSQTSNSDGNDAYCFSMGSNWTQLERTWNAAYEAINYCNDFLENMAESPLFSQDVASSGPNNMQHMYAEAKCIRAMLYLDLVRNWGDVVYRKASTKVGMDFYHEGVTDRSEILSDLIEDLKPVEKMLKYAADLDEGVERVSREYCQALIGQIALWRGGWWLRPGAGIGEMKRDTDYQEYYKIAQEYLGKVISEAKHSLSRESFQQMWDNECNWTVLNNGDVIFEIPMLKDSSGSLGYRQGVRIDLDTDNPFHNFGKCSNSTNFCGLYPFTFDAKDLRMETTCVPYRYDSFLNQVQDLGSKCVAGWGIGKWNKMKMGSTLTGTEGNTGINSIRMRYADVLLMYAEAVNELSGPTTAAQDALKEVRRRAFDPADYAEKVDAYVAALGSPDKFFEAIVNERAWEFGGEGIRRYDLARWNLYGKTLKETYDKFIEWGQRANGLGGALGEVRDQLYWQYADGEGNRLNTSVDRNRKMVFMGLHEPVTEIPSRNEWASLSYASNWWYLNQETATWEADERIKWSFRGYINVENASSITGSEPVRYLCPYPTRLITSHRGSIQQQYGYR